MTGFYGNIEALTADNDAYWKVIFTGKHSQLVLMSIAPSDEIGVEVHGENDQFFRFETGEGKVIIEGEEYTVGDGDAVVVPAGAEHNVINTSSKEPLRLYTIYSPSHHEDGTLQQLKQDDDHHA